MTVNPFQKFVEDHARLLERGRKLPVGRPSKIPSPPKISKPAGVAVIFSPHPDDECIVGGLPLRLRRQAGWQVINVAVTLGSKPERQVERWRELKDACDCLGFELASGNRVDIHGMTRSENPAYWAKVVRNIARFLLRTPPRVIFVPHENDGHPMHAGSHLLILDALKTLPAAFRCYVVETEFWAPLAKPNLAVESGAGDVADLVMALSCHAGEVRRNPYHARLPAWMMDNVRRGAELVGGAGAAAPEFAFATLYRLRRWSRGRLADAGSRGTFLAANSDPAALFPD